MVKGEERLRRAGDTVSQQWNIIGNTPAMHSTFYNTLLLDKHRAVMAQRSSSGAAGGPSDCRSSEAIFSKQSLAAADMSACH